MSRGAQLPQRTWYESWMVVLGIATFLLGLGGLYYTYQHNLQISEADKSLRQQLEHSATTLNDRDKTITDLRNSNASLQAQVGGLQSFKENAEKKEAQAIERDRKNAETIRQLQAQLVVPTIDFTSQASTALADALASPRNSELPARRLMEQRNELLRILKSSGADIAQAIDALDYEFDKIDGVLRNPPVDRDRLAALMKLLNDNWTSKKEILQGRVNSAIERLGNCRQM
jgi:hypothetical protein